MKVLLFLFADVCDENSRLRPPADFPVCGFDGKLCVVDGPNVPLIVSVVLSCLMVGLIVTAYLLYRHYKV